MGKIIFLAVFITLSGLFIAQGYNMWQANSVGNWDTMHGYEILGNYTFLALLPDDGYDFTSANTSSRVTPLILEGDGTRFLFDETDPDSDDAISLWVVRDNALFDPTDTLSPDSILSYPDFFFISIEYGGLFGFFDEFVDLIPFPDVVNNRLSGMNVSMSPITLGHRQYTLLINTTSDYTNFENDLYNNAFNIRVILTTEDQTPSGSMWAIIGQILTADIPNVHWLVNLILFTISWSMISVIVIEVWARLWPL